MQDYKTDGEKLDGTGGMRTEREAEGAGDRERLCGTMMVGVKGFARRWGSAAL